jgi:DNA-binding CsgD family transcriptional regulator/sugar-specific transcriptional regulator TrmB
LTKWGLSPEADLVYRALAEYGPQLVGELSRSLGVPARRIRIALEELAGVGAAHPGRRHGQARRVGEARVWSGAATERVVSELRTRHVELVRARYQLSRHLGLADLVDADLSAPGAVRPLYGLRIRARLGELIALATHEHLSMSPEPSFDAAQVRAAAPTDRALAARGLDMLALGVPPAAEDATGALHNELLAGGMRYREVPTLPAKLLIFDRTTAILPIDPADSMKGAIEVTAPSAVAGLVAFFLRWWEEAPAPQSGVRPTMKLTPREQAIVSMLAAGHTDASTAHQLGISSRTIAYTLRGLMDRYGVQNRFQLGLMLGAYAGDQIPPPPADGTPVPEEHE